MREAYRQVAACSQIRLVNNSQAGAIDYAAWLKIKPDRMGVHRNGVDPSSFSKAAPQRIAALRKSLGIPDGARVVGSLFRFYPEKDPLLWAEVARHVANKHADVHFVVFGVGPLKATIEDFARKHQFVDRLHLPGTIKEANLALGLYDVFVLTSRFEGTPNVIIEATMLGVPVVTTAAGGAVETVDPAATGLVEHDRDADRIASKVLSILDDPSWRKRAPERGPEFIMERFGLERMVDEAIAYYGFSRGYSR
jgi:glycosyltransferase involved in cell wall biosynthesis